MKNLWQKLGGRIRSFRAGAGMPQSALAQAGGLTNGYRSAMERGKVTISITMNSLADARNVPLAALLDCRTARTPTKTRSWPPCPLTPCAWCGSRPACSRIRRRMDSHDGIHR